MLIEGFCCDICGDKWERRYNAKDGVIGKMDLIRAARKKGWSVGKQMECPYCKKLPKGVKKLCLKLPQNGTR